MSKAGVELRKWLSNDPELIADVQADINNTRTMGERMAKVLGINWKSDNDVYRILYRTTNNSQRLDNKTKHIV